MGDGGLYAWSHSLPRFTTASFYVLCYKNEIVNLEKLQTQINSYGAPMDSADLIWNTYLKYDYAAHNTQYYNSCITFFCFK